jgi:hypothetical protein
MNNDKIHDKVLNRTITLKTLQVLRRCPVDIFFTAQSTGLHGSTLKSLYVKGYLNCETTKDGLGLEYYLNNHGHRLRGMLVNDFDTPPPVRPYQ